VEEQGRDEDLVRVRVRVGARVRGDEDLVRVRGGARVRGDENPVRGRVRVRVRAGARRRP